MSLLTVKESGLCALEEKEMCLVNTVLSSPQYSYQVTKYLFYSSFYTQLHDPKLHNVQSYPTTSSTQSLALQAGMGIQMWYFMM